MLFLTGRHFGFLEVRFEDDVGRSAEAYRWHFITALDEVIRAGRLRWCADGGGNAGSRHERERSHWR